MPASVEKIQHESGVNVTPYEAASLLLAREFNVVALESAGAIVAQFRESVWSAVQNVYDDLLRDDDVRALAKNTELNFKDKQILRRKIESAIAGAKLRDKIFAAAKRVGGRVAIKRAVIYKMIINGKMMILSRHAPAGYSFSWTPTPVESNELAALAFEGLTVTEKLSLTLDNAVVMIRANMLAALTRSMGVLDARELGERAISGLADKWADDLRRYIIGHFSEAYTLAMRHLLPETKLAGGSKRDA